MTPLANTSKGRTIRKVMGEGGHKPIGCLLLYILAISSGSEVIRKNVQNINCWFSTMCDVIGWVSRLLRYLKKNENRYRKKNTDNTDISVFFRNCILLILCKICLI